MQKKVDPGIYGLVLIANHYKIKADYYQLKHIFAVGSDGSSKIEIVRAARELGLKSRSVEIEYKKLSNLNLPAMVNLKDIGFVILTEVGDDEIKILKPIDSNPEILDRDEFKKLWDNNIILFIPREMDKKGRKFGVSWFIPEIWKYKKMLFEILGGSLVIQLLGLVSPLITQVVIDKVLVHKSFSTLKVLGVGLIIIICLESLFGLARTYVFTHATNKIDVTLNTKLFKHLFSLPMNYFETRNTGKIIARMKETEKIRRFLTGVSLSTVLDLLFIIIYIIVMFFYSVPLTGIVIMSLPLFVILSIVITPIFKQKLDEKFEKSAEIESFLVENVTGIETMKSFALENLSKKKWEDKLSSYVNKSYQTKILAGNAGAIAQLIKRGTDIFILWIGAKLVMERKLSIGQLVAFRMFAGRVSSPILRIVRLWQNFQEVGVSINKLKDIFSRDSEDILSSSNTRLPSIEGNIDLKKIVFRYKANTPEVIKDLSVEIKSGETIGIVGRSGSGKSTLGKLIQRLYLPESGKILIDGVDIAVADPVWLRRQIGVVLQENFLFNMSIKENISIHDPSIDEEKIISASKMAGAHDFIKNFPDGYNTMVGERGVGLSGGERQRVAIARALITNPKILIFDEATSALDYESEEKVQKNIDNITEDRTTLVIAHRMSTLRNADKIMVMDKGELVEFGPHKELIERKGLYHYLWSSSQ